MIPIKLLGEAALAHQAYRLAVAESGHVAAVARQGEGTLLAPGDITGRALRLPEDWSDIALSAAGGLLAVATRRRMVVIATGTSRRIYSLNDSVESVCFHDGVLWSAARWDEDSIAVEVREPDTWKVLAREELTDPFGDSFFYILPHPRRGRVAIWAAAGQDGQCLFWAHRDGARISIDRFPGLDNTTWPSFTASGDRFLAIAGSCELRLYDFPSGPLRATMPWPGYDHMRNQMGDFVFFVDDGRALVTSLDERLYLVNVEKMELAGEVSVPADLRYFAPLPGGEFLSVHNHGKLQRILRWSV